MAWKFSDAMVRDENMPVQASALRLALVLGRLNHIYSNSIAPIPSVGDQPHQLE